MVGSGKTNDNSRGEYLTANILSVNTCKEIKDLYNSGVRLSGKLDYFIRREMEIPTSTFYKYKFYDKVSKQFSIDADHDARLIVEFDNEKKSMEEGMLTDEFVNYGQPITFIPVR